MYPKWIKQYHATLQTLYELLILQYELDWLNLVLENYTKQVYYLTKKGVVVSNNVVES